MKALQLVPAMEEGGVERYVTALNRLLVSAGWENAVVSAGGRLEEDIRAAGGRTLRFDLRSKNPFTAPFRALALSRLIRREHPDVVVAHSRVPAWLYVLAMSVSSRRQPAFITYAHGANSVSRYSEVMTRGRFVMCPSEFIAGYLKDHYAFDHGKLKVVPHAVDPVRFDPARLDLGFVEKKREEWGIEAGMEVVMAVGRITPVKGYEALIRRFAADGGAGRRLVIVGGAERARIEYFERLKGLVRELFGENPPVVFAGAQSKIPECLSLATRFVSANTTKPEAFGLSIIEAYAMNLPVEAKHFGGAAEIMDAVAAELESGRVSTYREAVMRLYSPELLARRTLAVYAEAVTP